MRISIIQAVKAAGDRTTYAFRLVRQDECFRTVSLYTNLATSRVFAHARTKAQLAFGGVFLLGINWFATFPAGELRLRYWSTTLDHMRG